MLECENAFWSFSLAVYAKPGVADECLALQDRLNIDINALLFCAWLGAEKKVALDDKGFAEIDAQVERWHKAVVRPLRAVRQSMKPLPEQSNPECVALRKSVAAAELRAEQIEQAFLFEAAVEIAKAAARVATAAEENVLAYLQRCAGPATDIDVPKHLIAAALSGRMGA